MTDQTQQLSIIETYAAERNMGRDDLVVVMMQTIMPRNKAGQPVGTKADLIGFLQIARRFDLDPWAREIFMIVTKGGVLRPYISVDGYSKIANRQPDYNGCQFEYEHGIIRVSDGDKMIEKEGIVAVTCRIYKKSHDFPTVVTEFFDECYRNTDAWNRNTSRMLRHRAFIQGVRLAFGISGAFDPDSEDDSGMPIVDVLPSPAEDAKEQIDAKPKPPKAPKRNGATVKPPQEAAESDLASKGSMTAEQVDDFIQRLSVSLQSATQQSDVDEIWEAEDVEATLSFDEDALQLAAGLRSKALKRLQ